MLELEMLWSREGPDTGARYKHLTPRKYLECSAEGEAAGAVRSSYKHILPLCRKLLVPREKNVSLLPKKKKFKIKPIVSCTSTFVQCSNGLHNSLNLWKKIFIVYPTSIFYIGNVSNYD